jgi:photosystem II stability/assembly factor-like uncharacterized protein
MRNRCLAHAALILVALAQAAAAEPALPTGPALDRPAVMAGDAARAVLLGAARAGERIIAVGERGIIVKSDDGGTNWRQAPVPVSVTLTAVRFADAQHGYAVGHGGTVLATSDGGATWTRCLDGRRIAEIELAAAKDSGDAAALKSAERLQADGPDKPLLDVLVLDGRRALVVGAYGLAMLTEDGGRSWASWRARLDNPKELHLYAVRRAGGRIVIAGEQGLVLMSLDDGRSFRRLALPYRGSFFTAELPAARAVVVAGLRGNAWRSDDDGANWVPLASPVPATITASAVSADGTLLFVNQAGLVLTAQGAALAPQPGAPLPPLNALLPLDGGQVLALSMRGAHLIPRR